MGNSILKLRRLGVAHAQTRLWDCVGRYMEIRPTQKTEGDMETGPLLQGSGGFQRAKPIVGSGGETNESCHGSGNENSGVLDDGCGDTPDLARR